MSKIIAIVASLDTKGTEVEFARKLITDLGHSVLLIDTGVRAAPTITPDISSQDVIQSAGLNWEQLIVSEKVKRIEIMTQAITAKLKALYSEGRFDAVFSMGGAQNTTMATSAMRALPLGVPKLMLTTMASGKRSFGPLVGTKDMVVMHSVADISGTNFITENVIGNAVAAICGMAQLGSGPIRQQKKTVVGATMLGITSNGVVKATQMLEGRGHDVVTFHANGVGGMAMEELIGQGMINAVLDMTLHEITSELFGGYCAGATGRLKAAATAGIPQVLVPGAIDMIDFDVDQDGNIPAEAVTREKKYLHNSSIVHAKVTQAEIIEAARLVAERVNQSNGPVTVLLPLRGFCEAGAPGGKLHDPAVDRAFIDTLRSSLGKKVKVVEVDHNINDAEFAEAAAVALLEYLP
ncbi:MAG: Tm-1-like ATP-binding domain-containing protein [Negativicutes bacterium]|nr:Tm-1-like ATP-binding domain-containing protein [Negativicutes bacterium]